MLLEKVKLFLRIEPDYNIEDQLLLGFIDEAKEYCKNAVGYLPGEDNPLFVRFILMYCANAYDNRELTANAYDKTNYNFAAILRQLKYCYEEE